MAQLLIRNLDEETINSLKGLAKKHNRSLQGEVKLVLEGYASRFAGRTFSDSAELVREDRER
jgi:plasmid stability protein